MRDDNLLAVRRDLFGAREDSLRGTRIHLNLANRMTLLGPNQLWAADITYIRLTCEFVIPVFLQECHSKHLRSLPDFRGGSHAVPTLPLFPRKCAF